MSCKLSTHSFPLVAPLRAGQDGHTPGKPTPAPAPTEGRDAPVPPSLSGLIRKKPNDKCPPPVPSHLISLLRMKRHPKCTFCLSGLISCTQLAAPREPQRPVAVRAHPAREDYHYQNDNRDLQRKPRRLSAATQTGAELFTQGSCGTARQRKHRGQTGTCTSPVCVQHKTIADGPGR